jgi:thioredoxin reductase
MDYEVVVVGGGMAGLEAAMMLGRALRRVLVVDEGQQRNLRSEQVHGFITRDGTPPAEMYRRARADLQAYGTVRLVAMRVDSVSRAEDGFTVLLNDGSRERAARLILATGLRETWPEVAGLDALLTATRGVLTCPYCDGFEVRGRSLAVLGADAMSARLALQLKMRFSSDVLLCTNGMEPELDDVVVASMRAYGLDVRDDEITRIESSDGQITGIVFASGETISRTGLFMKPHLQQPGPLAEQLGATLREDGRILVDDDFCTTAPGVYAIGDGAAQARATDVHQVILVAAEGSMAGFKVDQNLLLAEVERELSTFAGAGAAR